MQDFKDLVEKCDVAIRGGQANQAAKWLGSLNTARIPREWRLPLAQLCRRAGLWNLGLMLMAKIVLRDHLQRDLSPSESEWAEYGMLLLRIGATNEAGKILKRVDGAAAPEARQYLGLVHLTKWELPEAIACFNAYLKTSPPEYTALVCRLNLALAYIENHDFNLAEEVLDVVALTSKSAGHERLYNTSLIYKAQLHIQSGNFAAAHKSLTEGVQRGEDSKSIDFYSLNKWKLILEGLECKSTKPIDELRKLARAGNFWEDLRIADFFACKINFDLSQFLYLVFGTPNLQLRKRICDELNQKSDRDVFYLGPKDAPRMDISMGTVSGMSVTEPSLKVHQMIDIFLRDFYSPLRVASIFSELFPDENFDVRSSPDRVHQIMSRTRQWLHGNRIPVKIIENEGFYSAKITGKFSFKIPMYRRPIDGMFLYFEQLRKHLHSAETFTSKDVGQFIKASRHTLQRIINWGIENQQIERIGQGKNSKYVWTERGLAASLKDTGSASQSLANSLNASA